jgi:hypothetical protein
VPLRSLEITPRNPALAVLHQIEDHGVELPALKPVGRADFDLRASARLVQDVLHKLLLIPVRRQYPGLHAGRLARLLGLAHSVLGEGPGQQNADGPPSGDPAAWPSADRGELITEAVDVNQHDRRFPGGGAGAGGGGGGGGGGAVFGRAQQSAISDGIGQLVDGKPEAPLLGQHRATRIVLRGSHVPDAKESEGVLSVPAKDHRLG